MLQYSQFNSYLQSRCCGSISCYVGMCRGAVAGWPLLHDTYNEYKILEVRNCCLGYGSVYTRARLWCVTAMVMFITAMVMFKLLSCTYYPKPCNCHVVCQWMQVFLNDKSTMPHCGDKWKTPMYSMILRVCSDKCSRVVLCCNRLYVFDCCHSNLAVHICDMHTILMLWGSMLTCC